MLDYDIFIVFTLKSGVPQGRLATLGYISKSNNEYNIAVIAATLCRLSLIEIDGGFVTTVASTNDLVLL